MEMKSRKIWHVGLLTAAFLLAANWVRAQDIEVAYAPAEFKLLGPQSTNIEPVLMAGFPVTAEERDLRYFVVVLIVREPKAWSGNVKREDAVITVRGGEKVLADYAAFGPGGAFTLGPGSGPPSRVIFRKTGIVVGSGKDAVTLSPILAFKMASSPIKYESTSLPAQFWFLFPFTGSRSKVDSVRIDTVELRNVGR
jgi:hypothetical protein